VRGFPPAWCYVGPGYGIGDSAVQTGADFGQVGTGLAYGAEHLWDRIF
jgi:hypothetical protein